MEKMIAWWALGENLNNRDKNSSEEKAVNRELNTITIACWA